MTASATITRIFSDGLSSAIPETALSVSKWAERYRVVADGARPGPWSNATVPYLVDVMDAASDPAVREAVFMASSQVAKTEFCNNVVGYYIHSDPASIMFVAETEDKGKAWSKLKLGPMIEATEVLRKLVDDPRDRTGNTLESKKFLGGHLQVAYATSPATLSSLERRILLMDEVDAYEGTKEGNPVDLAVKRTTTHEGFQKIIKVSSPRLKETSIIEPAYLASDQRLYFVPCPECGEFQTLKWSNIKWDGDPQDAYYVCGVSGCVIEHHQKAGMLAKGHWRAQAEFRGIAGFRIWEGYSPFTTWGSMAERFLKAKPRRDTFQTFVNTVLGETWEEEGDFIDYTDLMVQAEEWDGLISEKIFILTAGVDVQGDRIEVEVVGWTPDYESWSVCHHVIYGSPAEPSVWNELAEFLSRYYDTEDGLQMRVKSACIDSGGHHTTEVYDFCLRYAERRWFAVKGYNSPGRALSGKPSKVGTHRNLRLYMLGTEAAKDVIFSQLKITDDGPGKCHFPDNRDESYFKQFRAEKAITKYVGGIGHRKYVKVSPNARNEALDLRVYALAALDIIKRQIKGLFSRKRGTRVKPAEAGTEAFATATAAPASRPSAAAPSRRRRGGGGGGWISGMGLRK